jgi:hypothetical protein
VYARPADRSKNLDSWADEQQLLGRWASAGVLHAG